MILTRHVCVLAVAAACGGAQAESFLEFSAHWAKADSKAAYGNDLDPNRVDLKTIGGGIGVAQQFHRNIGWDFGYQFKSVGAKGQPVSNYHKSDSVSGGVRFNSSGPVQGFIRLGVRLHFTREQVNGVSYRETGPSVYFAPGVSINGGPGSPRFDIWASRSAVHSKAADDLYGYTQVGITLGVPID